MRLYSLSTIIIIYSLLDPRPARTLQIFDGTLIEIMCSADVPVFRLMDQEGEYNSYNDFPGLFGIEAIPFLTENSVTLYINGTNRSNNLIVVCGNVDLSSGTSNQQFHILFTLILEFVGILPAPNDVHYIEDPPGYLQTLWEPPTIDPDELDLQNISIRRDARIIQYTIYITTEESTIVQVYNASGTSFAIGIDKIPCSFWFQVAAVNPAGVGERSPPQNLTFGSHTGCIRSMSSTTVMIIEPILGSSGLSVGEVIAITIGVVLIIVGLSVTLAIVFTLKLKNDKHQHVKQRLKSQIRSDPLSDPKDSVAEIEKCVESDHCGSGNDCDTVDDINQPSDSTPTRTYSHDGPPVCSYLYAEIDVVAKRKNKVPEPSSTEDIDHHVYAVLEQPSNQSTSTDDVDEDVNHPADAQD